MTDSNSLIARLEAATEGSQQLDNAIFVSRVGSGIRHPNFVPQYTTSIDAAINLLDSFKCHVSISWPAAQVELVFTGGPVIETSAATPALAICIASLKAQHK